MRELLAPAPRPNAKAGGPPLIDCPRLPTQYTSTYPSYMEAVSYTHKLSASHVVAAGPI